MRHEIASVFFMLAGWAMLLLLAAAFAAAAGWLSRAWRDMRAMGLPATYQPASIREEEETEQ